MPDNDQHGVIREWIAATNTHDTDRYLSYFTDDAILDDPSVGRVFAGRQGIGEYFASYFIGYNTHARLVRIDPGDGYLHVEVDFTGDFPGGRTGGFFDITFSGGKLERVRADLL